MKSSIPSCLRRIAVPRPAKPLPTMATCVCITTSENLLAGTKRYQYGTTRYQMQAQTPRPEEHSIRTRLLDVLAAAIVEKGYAVTTIADIARHAKVSKRTIYEHYADKETAFLALYTLASREIIRMVMASALPELPWEEQIDAATRTYLAALESQPE